MLFLIFNRPEPTRRVFESIRGRRPRALFVAGDGPRPGFPGDAALCEETRQIASAVDWDCRLQTQFAVENLGPGPGVSTAITWFFDHVEEGIILEDDCVPNASFYRFCEELLDHYRTEPRIMHISGHNYQYGRRRGNAAYYFSRYTHVGGWATWRRAWNRYDITEVPAEKRGEIWDAAWMLSVRKSGGLAAIPNRNLVSNIGFGADATHTRTLGRFAFVPLEELTFPLIHPESVRIDKAADTLTYYANFRNIRFLRLLWAYQLLDFIKLIPNRAGKLTRRLRRVWKGAGSLQQ